MKRVQIYTNFKLKVEMWWPSMHTHTCTHTPSCLLLSLPLHSVSQLVNSEKLPASSLNTQQLYINWCITLHLSMSTLTTTWNTFTNFPFLFFVYFLIVYAAASIFKSTRKYKLSKVKISCWKFTLYYVKLNNHYFSGNSSTYVLE